MPTQRVDFKHVRANASFERVAAHYSMKLIGSGEQRTTLCTFHDEDTPSLKINVAKSIFHCFGCEKHGNILDFVTYMEGGDPNVDADLRAGAFALADICGIDPLPAPTARTGMRQSSHERIRAKPPKVAPARATPPAPNKEEKTNKPLSFSLKLDATHPYLAERGLSAQVIETFGLGVADRGLMKGRLAIAIHNQGGALIAYAGRWAAKELPKGTPKYLLPEGFAKQLVLFNLHRLPKEAKEVVMVESYFSVFRLHERGTPVVSPMGHSVSEEQCSLLRAKGIERVRVLFDGDEAGAQGIADSVPLLARHFYAYAPPVPQGFKPHRASDDVLNRLLQAIS